MTTALAAPLRRVAAYAIDWLLFACWCTVVFAAVWLAQDGRPEWPASAWTSQAIGFTLTTLPFAAYFALTEASTRGATIGKRLLGLCVSTTKGTQPSLGQTAVRAAGKLLPWEIGHTAAHQLMAAGRAGVEPSPWIMALSGAATLLAVGMLATLWSRTRRTPYDRLAGTVVVAAP